MTNGHVGDHLSWGDALFLYLERAGMPLNIACVSMLDGHLSLDECVQFIEAKLPLLPRYYERVVVPPLNIGFPSWEYDPKFHISNHISEVKLKRGSELELKALAGKIFGTVMDRNRPLWDVTLATGLSGNRTGIIMRIHHCLADGIAGMGLMNLLMDPTPESRVVRKKQRPQPPVRQRDSLTQLLDGWLSSYSDILGRALSAYSDISNVSAIIAGAGNWPVHELSKFLPELSAPTERLFFNITYQGPQRFAFTRIPVADIKAVREKGGATFNDVILALITTTIGRYAALHGDALKGRFLRMMVPVNVRGSDSPGELGNRILLLPFTVPLGISNPKRLLAAVHKRTEFLKGAHIAELFGLAGGLVGAAPSALQALVGPVASLLPVTPFNLVCTNVRGPETPLYFAGHKLLDWYPYVPVGGEMALNCAILSYNGMAYFGFSGDVHAAPDIQSLEGLLQQSFTELQRAAAPKTPRKRKTKAKPTTTPETKARDSMRVSKPAPIVPIEAASHGTAANNTVNSAAAAD